MTSSLITALKGGGVCIPSGFSWKFYGKGNSACALTLSPVTYEHPNLTVGLLDTPNGCLFVRLSSMHSLLSLSVEDLQLLNEIVNDALIVIGCSLLKIGKSIRLFRRKTGTYILAIDQCPIAKVESKSVNVLLPDCKSKKVYELSSYIDILPDNLYGLMDSVNGLHGIDLGVPLKDVN